MKINRVDTFRDGGTFMIETDEGFFWVPNRQSTNRLIRKGAGYFNPEIDNPVANMEELTALVAALAPEANMLGDVRHSLGMKKGPRS